jgi:DNA polymerase-3 subunit beta
MVVHVNRESLLKSINIADSIVSSKNINIILSNCLFNVAKDSTEIISTDNEIAIRTILPSNTDSAISFAANGKKFSSILKELPNDELVLNVSESFLIDITSKSKEVNGHYTLFGFPPGEFPEIPRFMEEDSMEIDQALLKKMIGKVMYAASTDTIKPVFNGIYLVSENDGSITSVATDSRRLALLKASVDLKVDLGEGIIIPLKTIHELGRLLESSGTCKFSFKNNQCFFKIADTEIISRIVDGQFPNYRQVIPKEYLFEIEIEKRKFLDAVRRVMIFTREPANKIVLNMQKDRIIIQANTPELGEAEEEITVKSDKDEKISIGINAQFLIDSLKEMDSDYIQCGVTGQMSPLTISPLKDRGYLSIIMPIQIKSSHSE